MLKLNWNGYGRRLAMALYVSSAIFIASHIVNAFVANELTAPPTIGLADSLSDSVPSDSSPEQRSSDSSSPQPPQQQAQAIVASGLFALPQATGPRTGPGQHTAASAQPLELAKKVILLGTAIGSTSGGAAIFEDLATKEQRLVRLHHSLLNIGELVAIEKDRALIQSGGQEEWITSAAAMAMANPNRFPLPVPVLSGPEPFPQPTPDPLPTRRLLKREDLKKWLPNAYNDRLRPNLDQGKAAGLILFHVEREDGFFDRIGLKKNDLVHRINGVEVTDRDFLLESILPQLTLENSITVDFIRNGKLRTLSYVVE
jgi:type II secretory pathway component PulC